MPIKLFTDGEILTASSVNTYFMDQALLVFENETVRDAAFGGAPKPALQEGRICYLKSDKTLYIYTFAGDPETLQWTPQLAEIEDNSITNATIANNAVTSDKIFDGTIVNADISPSADIALSKLAIGALPTTITVASANIVNETIENIDISPTAAIALTKLGAGALPTNITVVSDNIVNGTIVNDDINSLAAIAQSKISGLSASFSAKLDTTATAVNSQKIDGRTVFVQNGTPEANAIGDIWFQVAGIAPL
jgi:hypothetical protein